MTLTKEEIRKLYGESSPVKMSFLNKIKMLFLHPAHFFEGVKNEKLMPSFTMFIVFFLIGQIVSLVTQIVASPNEISLFALSLNIIIGLLTTFIVFLWVHFFVWLFKGREGLQQTLKAFMYASVPVSIVTSIVTIVITVFVPGSVSNDPLMLLNPSGLLTLGIVAIVYAIIQFWGLYLDAVGIGKLQNMGSLRALGVILLSGLIIFVLSMIFLLPLIVR